MHIWLSAGEKKCALNSVITSRHYFIISPDSLKYIRSLNAGSSLSKSGIYEVCKQFRRGNERYRSSHPSSISFPHPIFKISSVNNSDIAVVLQNTQGIAFLTWLLRTLLEVEGVLFTTFYREPNKSRRSQT